VTLTWWDNQHRANHWSSVNTQIAVCWNTSFNWIINIIYVLYNFLLLIRNTRNLRMSILANTVCLSMVAVHLSSQLIHGLSRRYDGSHHHECDLLWARSPICERHIRWQIWHSKLLVDGGPDLCRSRLASNSWMRRTSNSSTADLHVKCQPALSIVSVSSSEGVMPHWVIVLFRQSNWLCRYKTHPDIHLRNDLLCVEWVIKHY